MKSSRLLTGTLAMIMIAALIIPAYAQTGLDATAPEGPAISSEELAVLMQANDDVVFDNGVGTIDTNVAAVIAADFRHADDFVLVEDTFITDFHFPVRTFLTSDIADNLIIEYYILSDSEAGNSPGDLLTSGTLQIVQIDQIDGIHYMVWADFEDPIFLNGGVTYWIVIGSNDGSALGWLVSDSVEFGSARFFVDDGGLVNWQGPFSQHLWFQITGTDQLVGGESLPIDSTALVLAGAQSFSWMIPVVLSGIGIGLFAVSRKSE